MDILGYVWAYFGLYNGSAGRVLYTLRGIGHNFWTAEPISEILGILELARPGLSDSIEQI